MKLFIANVINRFGDAIDALAFAWMVYEITGQRSWSAVIFGLNSLPTILFMPFAGVWVERINKKGIMIVTDLCRAVLVSIVATLYMTGHISPVILAISTLLMSTFEAFRIPAGIGLFPEIVPKEKYTIATSLSQSFTNVSSLLGMAAFGVIIAVSGLQGAMYVNAATFLGSAIFISAMKLTKRAPSTEKPDFMRDLKQGLMYLISKRVVFMICTVGSLIGVLFMPISSLMTPYIKESLRLGEGTLSALNIAMLTGTILGTFFFPKIHVKLSKFKLFIIGGLSIAITYIVFVLISYIAQIHLLYTSLMAIAFIFGFGSSFMSVVVNVSFMEQVETSYLSRVGSIFNAIAQALTPISSFLLAAVAVYFTVNQLFVVSGIATFLLFMLLSVNKTLRTIDGGGTDELHHSR